jgi:hypothetical protein
MTMYSIKKTGTALAAAMLVALMLTACGPAKKLTTQQVQSVVGLSEDEVRAKLGGPHYLTNAGESVWWSYDGVIDTNGAPVECHVILRAGRVDKVEC